MTDRLWQQGEGEKKDDVGGAGAGMDEGGVIGGRGGGDIRAGGDV